MLIEMVLPMYHCLYSQFAVLFSHFNHDTAIYGVKQAKNLDGFLGPPHTAKYLWHLNSVDQIVPFTPIVYNGA